MASRYCCVLTDASINSALRPAFLGATISAKASTSPGCGRDNVESLGARGPILEKRHHVVIIGGGFGGLQATRALRHAPVRITLVDSRNFHLFQPLLYQVATGGLSAANIASPLRAIVKRQGNAQVLLGEVINF